MKKFLALFAVLLFSACFSTGAQKTLDVLADALEKKDANLFLAQMDTKDYAANMLHTQTSENKALSAVDSVGRSLGLGGMANLLGGIINVEADTRDRFTRGVGTGELEAECKKDTQSGCPWVAAALRSAEVKNVSDTAAVARVTTPAAITTWLALQKRNDHWIVVGQAPREDWAAAYAQGTAGKDTEQPAVKNPAGGGNSPDGGTRQL